MTIISATWARALEDFAGHLDRTQTSPKASSDIYLRRLRTVAKALSHTSPWTLEGPELAEWLDDHNWSIHTRKGYLVALRRFYAWGVQAGRLEYSPMAGVPDGNPRRPGPMQRPPRPEWLDLINGYLTHLRAGGRRVQTIKTRREHLIAVSHHFADPWKVSTADLALYLSRPDWSPSYRRSIRATFSGFYGWALDSGLINRNPVHKLAPVMVPRGLPRPADSDAVSEALAKADDRIRLAIELGAYAGLRIGEVVQVKVTDFEGGSLRVNGKGGHERRVPLHPNLAMSLQATLDRRERDGVTSPWLFPSTRTGHLQPQSLGKLVTEQLGGRWTPHTLRHWFATQAYRSTRDLRAVQELLGHSRPETTARYAAVPEAALTAAVAGVSLV